MFLSGHTQTKLTSHFTSLTPPRPFQKIEPDLLLIRFFLSSHRAARHCCCMMGRLQRGAQSISLTGAGVHYVSEMTPKTSHNPWVRFSPPCRSGALIFISSCPSSPTSNALSHFFFAHFLLIHRHLPQHLFDGRRRRGKSLFLLPSPITFSVPHFV